MASKVRFGLKNVHYAVLTETVSGGVVSYSWDTPVAVPGAVTLDLAANGDISNFYADNIVYFSSKGASGFSGDLEVALVPDAMLTDLFGYTLDATDKTLVKSDQSAPVRFALLYQIDGDAEDNLYVLYNCTATDPNVGSATITETTDPQTQSMTITASALADGSILGRTTAETTEAIRTAWFTAVYRAS